MCVPTPRLLQEKEYLKEIRPSLCEETHREEFRRGIYHIQQFPRRHLPGRWEDAFLQQYIQVNGHLESSRFQFSTFRFQIFLQILGVLIDCFSRCLYLIFNRLRNVLILINFSFFNDVLFLFYCFNNYSFLFFYRIWCSQKPVEVCREVSLASQPPRFVLFVLTRF